MKKKIPVIIVAGFLGAGKTTLLNHILKNSVGQRIGIIVNDFGAVNIDAMLVAGQADEKVELSNGCICCTLAEGGIDETLAKLIHPESTIDAVIIEASGIAEPAEIATLVKASKNKLVEFGGIVYVVDAANFDDTQKQHPSLLKHLSLAQCIVLNKTDSVHNKKHELIKEQCRSHNPHAALVSTSHGRLDARLLFDMGGNEQPVQLAFGQETHNHTDHLHDSYQTVSFTSTEPIDPQKLKQFLKNPPAGLYRLKGVVYFGMKGFEQKFIVQSVGRSHTLQFTDWAPGEALETTIVCIGAGIDETQLHQTLQQLVDESPEDLAAGGTVDIMSLEKIEY